MLSPRAKAVIVFTPFAMIILLAATLWHASAIPNLERAPCRECSSIYSSTEVIDLNICALSASPEAFRGRLVRVHGTFIHDSCYTSMRGEACRPSFIRVGISRDVAACGGTQKALAICTGFGEWYDSSAEVTLVCRVREIQNQKSCNRADFGLDVLCLESVRPINGFRPPRLQYAIGRLLDFVFRAHKT